MIRVFWPFLDTKNSDAEILTYLDNLSKLSPEVVTWELANEQTILFIRDDDALAFKLKFGL